MRPAVVVALILTTATTAASQTVRWDDGQVKFDETERPLGAPLYAPGLSLICPLALASADDVDKLVSCPGWETRPCRERDARGKLRRSSAIKREFLRRYGYPKGRPGFVLDHIFALAGCGDGFAVGCDVPWNIQFQSAPDGKAKDKWERNTCATDNDEEAVE